MRRFLRSSCGTLSVAAAGILGSSSSVRSSLWSTKCAFRGAGEPNTAAPAGSSSSGASTSSSQGNVQEAEELKKDQAALRKFMFTSGFGIMCAVTLWFGSGYAKKRYFGEEGSARVSVETRGRPSLGGPFVLVNTDGEVVTQADFQGHWTFFYFGFVHCPEICPVELNRMSKVVDAVRAEKPNQSIKPLFVSCDPRRDSLLAIREYLSVFHKDFIGLVGTPKQVNDACKSYRIYYSVPSDSVIETDDYLIDHSIAIFLFDPKGQFVDFFGNRYDEKEIAEKVVRYMGNFERDPTWTNW
ncbi:cytochrome c oxidase assembly factor, putative [Bodo saltans]|uniref:Cytochrome c oxidase assembly factor, putative n=1 Tax=Bodo saltans TaxID=75058 RepID=A0A0S4J8R8_BODSA|nr:cytochrome c oxidase assembly factor, putative [Bodo saltans]|eukprot:CUG87807.1 cytochrome c oxidase assembly factor, putative [Bodo saltans]